MASARGIANDRRSHFSAVKSERSTCNLTPVSVSPSHPPQPLALPPCPFLPVVEHPLDWRTLHAFRETGRDAAFYAACLEYAQALWRRRLAARALLCLDRAFGAELTGVDPILAKWPLPYAPLVWIIRHTPDGVFLGNPRVHFQHYADRMNAPRREQRRARAWACWALTRAARPEFPADPKHAVHEPTEVEISAALDAHGHVGECEQWRRVLRQCRTL